MAFTRPTFMRVPSVESFLPTYFSSNPGGTGILQLCLRMFYEVCLYLFGDEEVQFLGGKDSLAFTSFFVCFVLALASHLLRMVRPFPPRLFLLLDWLYFILHVAITALVFFEL